MKITTTAVAFVEADIVLTGNGPYRVGNGSPIATSNFLDSMVGAIRRMESALDDLDFDLTLNFATSGVELKGETKS